MISAAVDRNDVCCDSSPRQPAMVVNCDTRAGLCCCYSEERRMEKSHFSENYRYSINYNKFSSKQASKLMILSVKRFASPCFGWRCYPQFRSPSFRSLLILLLRVFYKNKATVDVSLPALFLTPFPVMDFIVRECTVFTVSDYMFIPTILDQLNIWIDCRNATVISWMCSLEQKKSTAIAQAVGRHVLPRSYRERRW